MVLSLDERKKKKLTNIILPSSKKEFVCTITISISKLIMYVNGVVQWFCSRCYTYTHTLIHRISWREREMSVGSGSEVQKGGETRLLSEMHSSLTRRVRRGAHSYRVPPTHARLLSHQFIVANYFVTRRRFLCLLLSSLSVPR